MSARRKCSNTAVDNALVKMSACCSPVGTHLSFTVPASTVSVMKWYFTSTCLVRDPLIPFLLTAIVD